MKLVSWNVAGFRAILKKGFSDFFSRMDADIFCLQEVKALEDQIDFFPQDYYFYLNPAERKGYSGVGIYTKKKPLNVTYGMGIEEHDHEGRIITLEYENFYLINSYVPNSKPDLERLSYRMTWEEDFLKYVKNLEQNKPVILCGDLNVAHQEIDIKNPSTNHHSAGFTDEERNKFSILLQNNLIDTYRYLYPEARDKYTWWTYIGNARSRNAGWRIDYFVISDSLNKQLKDAYIYSDILGSDHCPIGLDIEL